MNKKGFTLIELLIVIAILGILATALLAGIDPLEQFNKATDAGRYSKLREIYGAMQRLQVSGINTGTTSNGALTALSAGSGIYPTIQTELKTQAVKSTDLAVMYWAANGDDSSTYIAFCYAPVSKANKKQSTIIPGDGQSYLTSAGIIANTVAAGTGTLLCIY